MRWTALAACAAFAIAPLAGCGKEDEHTIPRDQGSTLIRLLRDARDQAGDPDSCDALQRTVSRIQVEVGQLPDSVDGDTRRSLTDGVDNLASSAQDECQDAETTPTETTPTTETAPPPTTTETEPPPTTTETEPPTTETTPPPPTTPDDGGGGNNGNGGAGAPGGEVPPGQQKKSGKRDKAGKAK